MFYLSARELDELLAYQRKESGSWVSYYPVQDRRESVVKLLDAQGNVVENVEYDPYGKATVYVGGTPQASSSVENPYLYQGRRVDPETGFVYIRNRYYHTGFGRWLSIDPGGMWADSSTLGNGYSYGPNAPTLGQDPDGKFFFIAAVLVGAVIGGVTGYIASDGDPGTTILCATAGAACPMLAVELAAATGMHIATASVLTGAAVEQAITPACNAMQGRKTTMGDLSQAALAGALGELSGELVSRGAGKAIGEMTLPPPAVGSSTGAAVGR